eukprot:3175521-Rhodomonas_salina.6
MSGTAVGCDALAKRRLVLRYGMLLRFGYAESGTDVGCGGTSRGGRVRISTGQCAMTLRSLKAGTLSPMPVLVLTA